MPRTVKSAVRALEVLELFDRLQREASVGEVARLLGYPLSSTSVLLSTMMGCGYLRAGAAQHTYVPTPRLARLGAWIGPFWNSAPARDRHLRRAS
ncbi:MAG TPA: helix-turn-helix domain-containing protein [Ramlibacter sp.]|nr:helix-turn-helix domain-containing protein [Ramlibacter sp.]